MNNFFGSGALALAAIIALLILGTNRQKGARYAVLVTLAVLIVCGCGFGHRY